MQSRRFIIRLHTDEICGDFFYFTDVSWINGLRDVYFFYLVFIVFYLHFIFVNVFL